MSELRTFPYCINGVGVDVHLLQHSGNGIVNVLLHGHAGVTGRRDIESFIRIAAQLPEATSILLRWDAGNLIRSSISGVRQCLSQTSLSDTRPGELASSLISGAVSAIADGFEVSRDNADRLAAALPALLELALHGHEPRTLTLMGHSLGGRIILHGAARQNLDFPHRDMVIMGTAAGWPGGPFPVLQRPDTRLINLYSPDDALLTLDHGPRPWIGLHGLPEQIPGCLDIPCHGYAHTDYWPNLPELAQLIGFAHNEPLLTNLTIFDHIPMPDLQAFYFPDGHESLRGKAARHAADVLAKLGRRAQR